MTGTLLTVLLFFAAQPLLGQQGAPARQQAITDDAVSFKKDVFPLIQKRCMPCHAQEENNSSELSLDTYDLTAKGGKNGPSWAAGRSSESIFVQKLAEKPPFGERMPLNSKRKIREGKASWLTPGEIRTIATWIDQGAKNN
jgi:uncharacterized membrane protein